MVIHINPDRIHLRSGGTGKTVRRQSRPSETSEPPVKPARATVNYIPGAESLRTLVAGAVEALRRGIYWDRGTILNLLV